MRLGTPLDNFSVPNCMWGSNDSDQSGRKDKVEERIDCKNTLSEKCVESSGSLIRRGSDTTDALICAGRDQAAREAWYLNRPRCSSVKCNRPIALEENNSDPLVSSELGTLAAS